MSRKSITLSALLLLLSACVSTEGLSEISTKPPKGNPSSAVTVETFSDLQCPACKRAHQLIVEPLLRRFPSEIVFHYRHFPLRSIHAYAVLSAEASECAADQGKFWEYVAETFLHQDALTKDDHRKRAANLGLDAPLFDRCLQSGIKRDIVMEEFAEGRKRSVNGTPTFFVNGRQVNSTLEDLREAIVTALKATE